MELTKDKMILCTGKKRTTTYALLCLLSLCIICQNRVVLADTNVYRDLLDKGIATYEDGCRAISGFADIPAGTMTFEEVVSELKKKGIAGKRWRYKADKKLTRGIMAYMICNVLDIKGGLTMHAIDATQRFTSFICRKLGAKDDLALPDLGMAKRYAFLEFQQRKLVPPGNKKTYISGHDLLAMLYRVEQYVKAAEKEKKQKEERKNAKEEKKQERRERLKQASLTID